jgi:hypothetical protein
MIGLWNLSLYEAFRLRTPNACTQCGLNPAEVGELCLDCYDDYCEKIISINEF